MARKIDLFEKLATTLVSGSYLLFEVPEAGKQVRWIGRVSDIFRRKCDEKNVYFGFSLFAFEQRKVWKSRLPGRRTPASSAMLISYLGPAEKEIDRMNSGKRMFIPDLELTYHDGYFAGGPHCYAQNIPRQTYEVLLPQCEQHAKINIV